MTPPSVRLTEKGVEIIDQTALPGELSLLELRTPREFFDAIKALKVRGAPAIGIFAGFAAFSAARDISAGSREDFLRQFEDVCDYLNSSRPTAVNLGWALRRMTAAARRGEDISEILRLLERECRDIRDEDAAMCGAIAENALELIDPSKGVLTHCNAGPLATSEYGTALGPILLAKERGIELRVFADETRPLLQGARLTAWELQNAGVDVTLICDNMASMVMKSGKIGCVLVGCDRIAGNGDTANKIGTSGLAVLARHYAIPFYVLGPSSTIDPDCESGADIEIELRDGKEISELFFERPMAPPGVRCYNPAFDVTDAGLITAIITEKGIHRPPYDFKCR